MRRIYGDFSGARLKSWNGAIQSLAILQHQQRNNTTGNASDVALVIAAMGLMHKGAPNGFCLVSSDSDLTRLAQRLRKEGMVVYGFGEQKTVKAFRNSFNRFYAENLVEAPVKKSDAGGASAGTTSGEHPRWLSMLRRWRVYRDGLQGGEGDVVGWLGMGRGLPASPTAARMAAA